ncbi:Major facilitator superfamily MFS_1 [Lutibaculum baratangense AMV1]|uniref:Major facilitator superfamily MFS_1 n=2 Tax=Lutibaculum TaxID=1358438 RepID=V4R3B9_9HYPH|nr:Major facilitator superfamily MFS_1 [Lutibaculum baratangense AMV1]
MLFDWAGQPFYTVVTTFIFAPYFAAQVAPDPATGQSWWGLASAVAGLAVALSSPVLGAIADETGRRKAWLAAFSVLFVVGATGLWFAAPGGLAPVVMVLAAYVVATIGIEFATVFNNAMLPDVAPRQMIGRLSGSAWGLGYAGGLVALVLVLGLMTPMPGSDLTMLGVQPLVSHLAPAAGERLTGPLSALWYVVFVVPLFLFCPDVPSRSRLAPAVRSGLRELRRTLARLPSHRQVLKFFVARMLYQDGLNALVLFGGIYATGTFGWTTAEVGVFGILLAACGGIGAWAGGRADDRFGPKRVVAVSVAGLAIVSVGLLSVDAETVLFVIPAGGGGEGLFASTPERLYLLLGIFVGLFFGPAQAASRTILVRLAPRESMTEFFGLYALTGKLTAFLGPLAVGLLTAASGSQRVGISVVVVFLVAGLAVLATVRVPRSID